MDSKFERKYNDNLRYETPDLTSPCRSAEIEGKPDARMWFHVYPPVSEHYDIIKLDMKLNDIRKEVLRAKSMFPKNFNSEHEGYAVLLEEVDELWDEIKKNQRDYDKVAMGKEATQCGAMICRFLVELI